jgi:hypothetical protein
VEDNSYRLSLPPYMRIYSIVNVENLKIYDISMLDWGEEKFLPSIENLAPYVQVDLVEEIFAEASITRRQGQHDFWYIGLKGQLPGKTKWYSREKIEEKFPHLTW